MSRKKINKALLAAIVLCNHDEVRRLLAAGANIDATDAEHDEPAMVLATRFGDKKLVQLLIDEGAKINARDDRGRTALFFAEVSSEIFAVLIASGTDVHAADHEGNTLLMQKVSESP
jgi:ankyrin repeat protein